jgi:hypothetical protein
MTTPPAAPPPPSPPRTKKPPKGRQFQKGQSGNPGGRPKESAAVRDLAREHTEMAITRLAFWAKSKNAKASVAACVALLDRGWGKPVTEIDLVLRVLKELEGKSDEELKAIAGTQE